jgi:site-specific recombinase XerC
MRAASPETLKAYRSDLMKFSAYLDGHGISRIIDVNQSVILAYVAYMRQVLNPRARKQGLSDATIGRRLAAVSSYFDYLRTKTHPKLSNPVDDRSFRLKRNNGPKPVDEPVIDRLLDCITSERDKMMVILFLASGLRVSEMQQLDKDSIRYRRFDDGTDKPMYLGIGEVIGKGSKRRTFYVDKKSLGPLAEYLESRALDVYAPLFISEQRKRMSVRAMQERLSHWCKQAEVEHVRIHRLRHTYATRLANANINSIYLKELMGHNSFATTMQYFKLSDTTMARSYHAAMESRRR